MLPRIHQNSVEKAFDRNLKRFESVQDKLSKPVFPKTSSHAIPSLMASSRQVHYSNPVPPSVEKEAKKIAKELILLSANKMPKSAVQQSKFMEHQRKLSDSLWRLLGPYIPDLHDQVKWLDEYQYELERKLPSTGFLPRISGGAKQKKKSVRKTKKSSSKKKRSARK